MFLTSLRQIEQRIMKCSACGACCRTIGYAVSGAKSMLGIAKTKEEQEYWEALSKFPHSIDENGSCINLREDNTCGVYEDRPNVCRSEYVFDKLFKGKVETEEYNSMMIDSCNQLIHNFSLDDKYLL